MRAHIAHVSTGSTQSTIPVVRPIVAPNITTHVHDHADDCIMAVAQVAPCGASPLPAHVSGCEFITEFIRQSV
jgi:hypothetical protein